MSPYHALVLLDLFQESKPWFGAAGTRPQMGSSPHYRKTRNGDVRLANSLKYGKMESTGIEPEIQKWNQT
jgi:hypothetical protein